MYKRQGNGSTTAFTLGMEPGGENNTQVYIDGVYQQKDTYTVSGTTLTFSTAPPNLSTIEVMVIQVLPVGATTASQVSGSFNQLSIIDGVSAPSTVSGSALIYVDSADGDLKIKFGDGTVKTIVTDT